MSLSMGEMSILYLVPQTGRGTFMPSDLIFANRSLWCLLGAGLNAFSHWAHREQAIVIVSWLTERRVYCYPQVLILLKWVHMMCS